MNKFVWVLIPALTITFAITKASHAAVVDELLSQYQAEGAGKADAAHGKQQWTQIYSNNKEGESRSCVSCHTKDLHVKGKHANTGKPIDPLAPSVNPERLTDIAKVEKWFKRNCKWTMDRECTVQEKSDFLSFIRQE